MDILDWEFMRNNADKNGCYGVCSADKADDTYLRAIRKEAAKYGATIEIGEVLVVVRFELPVKPTYEEIWQACERLYPAATPLREAGTPLPRVLDMTAQHCFTNQVPENTDTRIVRLQLQALGTHGVLDYKVDR